MTPDDSFRIRRESGRRAGFAFVLFLLTLLTLLIADGCGVPARSRENTTENPATAGLRRILFSPALSQMTIGVKVVSLATGDTLFAHQSGQLFHPASNTKLFTAVGALKTLGTDYRFRTSVYGDNALFIRGDTLFSSLYLQGTGDPLLTTGDLEQLAGALSALGARVVAGDLIVDDGYFDDRRLGEGWMWDDVEYDYSAPISALTVNRNCARVVVSPGTRPGDPVAIRLEPPTAYMEIRNEATTGDSADVESLRVERLWRERQNTLVVSGRLPLRSGERRALRTVENPEMYAAALFREAFERNGVRMTGVTKKGRIPVSARMLASHISAPVTSALRDVLKDSDNLASELILKSMARYATGRPGSAEDGLRVLRGALRAVAGLDTLEYRLADGSGLSWYNLVTPDQIVALLSAASRDSLIRTPLMDALPVAGVDGSLTNRMRASAAAGKAMAKTGTLSGVSCLSGFVRTQDDETLVFSIMINHYIGSSSVARRAQDDVVSALAGLSRHQKRGDTP